MFEDRTLAREVWRGERRERVVEGGGCSEVQDKAPTVRRAVRPCLHIVPYTVD
jgi:hypothetical protein